MTDDELLEWSLRGRAKGATHIVVLRDLVELDYFPVFVFDNEVELEKRKWISESKTKFICVIKL